MTQARPEILRIGGVPEHFNMPWQLALESGAARATGLDCIWQDYATGTGAMLADLAAGQLDLAVLLTEGAALGLARELPVVPISLYTTSPLIWGLHVPPAAPWQNIDELRGRRFAISRYGSGSHLMSLALALEHGWPANEQTFEVVNDMPGAIRALANGDAEVFLWEHFTTDPAVSAGHFRRVGDVVSPWPAWVVCAGADVWRRQRTLIEPLLRIVASEASKLKSAPDASARIAARYELREAGVADWLARTDWAVELTAPDQALDQARAMLEAAGAIPDEQKL